MKPNKSQPSPEKSKTTYRCVAENLYKREPSGVYYVVLKRAGKQIWKSLKTSDRKLAERRLKVFSKQAANLRPQENPHIGFGALALQWLAAKRHTIKESTYERNEEAVKRVNHFFSGVSVRNITRQHCDEWVKDRERLKIAPQTFAHELDTMRGVFGHAVQIGLRLDNPAAQIQRKPIRAKRPTVPTREQFQTLVAAIRQSDGREESQALAKDGADLVELLAYSGCRLNEARSLKWSDVDFKRDVFTVTGGDQGTKNHETRTVPMNGALRQLLTRLHTESKPQPAAAIIKIKSARRCLETAVRRLGLPHFTHHTLRHFFATTCIESGGDVPTIAKLLGHKDGGALLMKTYSHLRQEHAFTVMKRVQFGSESAENIVPFSQHHLQSESGEAKQTASAKQTPALQAP